MNRARWINGAFAWTVWLILLPTALSSQDVETVSLKQAVEKALQNSREVALAQAQYNVARNTVDVNRAAFKPNLYTGSGAAYTYGFPQTPSGAAPSIVNLSYVQTLFNPALTAEVRASQERSEAQRLELEKTRNAVMLRAGAAYLELGKVRHSLDLLQNESQSNQRILNFTRDRSGQGEELPIEVTRAELAEARTEQKIVQLESRRRSLEHQLADLMGIPMDKRIEIESETLRFDETGRERDLTDRAIANSLDLRQAGYERLAREHRLEGEAGARWPTVELFSEYGLFSTFNNFQQYFQKFQRNNFNVGVQIRIPILTSQTTAKVALSRSELTVAELSLKNKQQNLALDVSNQYQRIRELDAAREVARLELKLAQENLQLVQARFQEGRANLRDVERARIDENEKWLAFLDGDYDRQKAQLELMNMTGDLRQLIR